MGTRKKNEEPAAPADADDSGIIDIGPDADAPAPAPKGRLGFLGNRKIVIGGVAALLLVGTGAGAAMMLMGGGKPAHGEATAQEEHDAQAEAETSAGEEGAEEGKEGELPLVDVPAMVVNMRSADGTSRYLKLRFMLEAKSAAKVDPLKAKLPAIIDAYQPFLRELRPEDVSGSAAVFRIKEEMLIRATGVAGKGMVKDVLIQDLVQQ